jgi:hypothetical protein
MSVNRFATAYLMWVVALKHAVARPGWATRSRLRMAQALLDDAMELVEPYTDLPF